MWTILVVLLIFWLLGFMSQVGGSLIHILPVAAVIVLIYNVFVTRRRAGSRITSLDRTQRMQ